MFNIQPTIETAIKKKYVLYIKYDDDFSEREIYPHALFESTAGKVDLWSIQAYNPASPMARNQVRVFTLKDLKSARLDSATFKIDPGFSVNSIKNCRRLILTVQR